jgi:hypothetical protein
MVAEPSNALSSTTAIGILGDVSHPLINIGADAAIAATASQSQLTQAVSVGGLAAANGQASSGRMWASTVTLSADASIFTQANAELRTLAMSVSGNASG